MMLSVLRLGVLSFGVAACVGDDPASAVAADGGESPDTGSPAVDAGGQPPDGGVATIGCAALPAVRSGFCADFDDGKGIADWTKFANNNPLSRVEVRSPSIDGPDRFSLFVSAPETTGFLFATAFVTRTNKLAPIEHARISVSLKPEKVEFKNENGYAGLVAIEVRPKYYVGIGLSPGKALLVEYSSFLTPGVVTPLEGTIAINAWNRITLDLKMVDPAPTDAGAGDAGTPSATGTATVTLDEREWAPVPLGAGSVKATEAAVSSELTLGLFLFQAGSKQDGFAVSYDDVHYETLP